MPQTSKPHALIDFPHEWTCTELVDGVKNRQAGAGRAFVARYSRRINQLVWRLLGACSEHDDVVQQIFVNAFRDIHKLREPEKLDSWLVSITVNTVRKELRSRKLRRFFVIFGMETETSGSDLAPEDQASAVELYRILGEIHPEERRVFILCMVEGYTQMEAARACGISLSTCKRRLARASDKAARLADTPGWVSVDRTREGRS